MELKEGYKQTDVGVIPEDWEVERLGNFLVAPPTYGANASAAPYDTSKPIYLRITDISPEGKFLEDSISSIDVPDASDYFLKTGDIVVARTGASVGKAYYHNSEALGPFAFAGYLIKLDFDPSLVSSSFIFNQLYSTHYKNWVLTNSQRSGQPGINAKQLQSFQFAKPSLAEQQAIAEVLSDVDAEIESLAQRHEKLVAQKQGLSEELLSGRTRLVEPKSRGFKQTEVGVIPADWEVRQLRHLLEIGHGRSQKEVEEESGPYPIYGTGGLMGFATDYLHPGPTVMIGRKGTIDKPRFSEGPVWTVDTLFYCDCKKQLIPRFAFELFQTIDWRSYNEASGVPSLSSKTILSIEGAIPPVDEQQAIAEVLSDVDAEIQAVAKLKAKVQAKKEGLMQTLLTGKIRLN